MDRIVVEDYLLSKGIKPSKMGFECITLAIMEIYKNPSDLNKLVKIIYPNVANIIGSGIKPGAVERRIRYAIQGAGKETNKEFLAMAYFEIRRLYEKSNKKGK